MSADRKQDRFSFREYNSRSIRKSPEESASPLSSGPILAAAHGRSKANHQRKRSCHPGKRIQPELVDSPAICFLRSFFPVSEKLAKAYRILRIHGYHRAKTALIENWMSHYCFHHHYPLYLFAACGRPGRVGKLHRHAQIYNCLIPTETTFNNPVPLRVLISSLVVSICV